MTAVAEGGAVSPALLAEISIEGRRFRVEKVSGNAYLLTGTRGAQYRTIRNRLRPHLMYLYNNKDWTKAAPSVWLTDKNGSLEVAPGMEAV